MRVRIGWLTLLLGGAIVLGGAAASPSQARTPSGGAEGCVLPDAIDEELAQNFEDELLNTWLKFNPDKPGAVDQAGSLANLLGFPGKYDLPPGKFIVTGIVEDMSNLPCPEPGGGSRLSGECIGMAMSFDDNGNLIDILADLDPDSAPLDMIESRAAGAPVKGLTESNPFKVHVNGFVAYVGKAGETGQGPRNHDWAIETFGVALDSGGDPNNSGKNRNAGAVNLKDDLPTAAKLNAKFKIEGYLHSENINCDGAGYFETTGSDISVVVDGIGVAALLGAGLGALFNARPAKTWRG